MCSESCCPTLTISSPILKDRMTSGNWSILVLSNNDNGDQVAFERDFTVTAAPESTVYYTPVITVNITTTPIVRNPTSAFVSNEARSM
jgi:hypothetical protein